MTRAAHCRIPRSGDVSRGLLRFFRDPLFLAVFAVLGALCLAGCFVARERVLADEALPGEHIRGIRRGVTTKQEILERFGPPAAIARRGTTMAYPLPGSGKRGRIDIPSDAWLELFSTGRTLHDTDIVYYYDASRLKATGVLIIPLVGGGYHSMEMVVERLWVLVDDRAGVVEDYVFRGAE